MSVLKSRMRKQQQEPNLFSKITTKSLGENNQMNFQKEKDQKYDLIAQRLREKAYLRKQYLKQNQANKEQKKSISLSQNFLQIQNIKIHPDCLQKENQNQKTQKNKPSQDLKLQSQIFQQKEQEETQKQQGQTQINFKFQGHGIQRRSINDKTQKQFKEQIQKNKLNTEKKQQILNKTYSKHIEEGVKKQDLKISSQQATLGNIRKLESLVAEDILRNCNSLSSSFSKQSYLIQSKKNEAIKELQNVDQLMNLSNEDQKDEKTNSLNNLNAQTLGKQSNGKNQQNKLFFGKSNQNIIGQIKINATFNNVKIKQQRKIQTLQQQQQNQNLCNKEEKQISKANQIKLNQIQEINQDYSQIKHSQKSRISLNDLRSEKQNYKHIINYSLSNKNSMCERDFEENQIYQIKKDQRSFEQQMPSFENKISINETQDKHYSQNLQIAEKNIRQMKLYQNRLPKINTNSKEKENSLKPKINKEDISQGIQEQNAANQNEIMSALTLVSPNQAFQTDQKLFKKQFRQVDLSNLKKS